MHGNDHDSSFLIEDGADVHVSGAAIVRIVAIFPGNPILAAVWIEAKYSLIDIGRLQFVLWYFEIEYAMKEVMGHVQFNKRALGQYSFDFAFEILPLPESPKVIRHEDPAVHQVISQDRHFVVAQEKASRLDHVNPWVIE